MTAIKTQDVYTTVAMKDSPLYNEIQEMVEKGDLKKHYKIVVLTKEQYDKNINEAKIHTSNAIKQLYVFTKDKKDFQKKADEFHNVLIENSKKNDR